MSDMSMVGIVGIVALLVVIGIAAWLISQGRKFKLTDTPEGQKPEWMRTSPPQETLDALQADQNKMAVFDRDQDERLAAPFAEQIEDIVHARIAENPSLQNQKVDFGTAPDGRLEIIVNDQSYLSVDEIPNEALKALIKQAIESYNQSQ